jgi:hypothetical protein
MVRIWIVCYPGGRAGFIRLYLKGRQPLLSRLYNPGIHGNNPVSERDTHTEERGARKSWRGGGEENNRLRLFSSDWLVHM